MQKKVETGAAGYEDRIISICGFQLEIVASSFVKIHSTKLTHMRNIKSKSHTKSFKNRTI